MKKVNLRGGGESPENIGEVRLGGGEEYASWFTWLGECQWWLGGTENKT